MQPFDPEQEHQALRREAAAQLSWRGGTLLAWCLWLLGSWMMTLGHGAAWAVRAMMLLVMVGLLLLWPALRLSQDRWASRGAQSMLLPSGRARPAAVLLDWLGLALIAQAVVWPFTVTANWTIRQTLWIDGAVLSWSLLAAALVAWGVQRRGNVARALAMLLCVALLLGEPLLFSLMAPRPEGALPWRMRISPLQTIWHLSEPGGLWSVAPWHTQVLAVGAAAIAAWALVLAMSRKSSRPV